MKIFEKKKKNQTIRGLKSDRRIERNKNTLTNNANAYTKLQETLKHFFKKKEFLVQIEFFCN